MECWVTFEKNHQTQRVHSLRFRFAMAMRGVLGIGTDLSTLSEKECADYSRWIDFYKQVRHLVQGGILHRAALPEIDDGLSVWQFTARDGREAYLSVVFEDYRMDSQLVQYRLADLDPGTLFTGVDETGKEQIRAMGHELMAHGLPGIIADGGPLCPGHARHLHLLPVNGRHASDSQ
jgi:alpha-galactosidase